MELMIGLVLALILTLAFIQTFLIIKNISLKQQGLARIQENARALYEILSMAISQSGNMGCNKMSDEISLFIHKSVDKEKFGLSPFRGVVQDKTKWPLHIRGKKVLSDVLWVNYAGEINKKIGKNKRVLIISDCRHADIFQSTDDVPVFTYPYPAEASIARFHSIMYYVAETGRLSQNNKSIRALYSTDLNGKTQERIEGVETFEVEFTEEAIKIICLLSSIESVKAENINNILYQEWIWEWPHCY